MLLNIDAGARVLFVKAKRPNLGAVMGDMFGGSLTADMPIMHQGHTIKTGTYVAPFVERHKVLLDQSARVAPPVPPVWVAPPVPSARVAPPANPRQLTDDEIGWLANWRRMQGTMKGPMAARMESLWAQASDADRARVDHGAGLSEPPHKSAPSEAPEEGAIQRMKNYGWDAVKLADAYSLDELNTLRLQVEAEHANPLGSDGHPTEGGRPTIYLFDAKGRKKLDSLSWAVTYKLGDARKAKAAQETRAAEILGPKEGDTKTEGGVTYTLRSGRWHRDTPEPAAAPPAPEIPESILKLRAKVEDMGGRQKVAETMKTALRGRDTKAQANALIDTLAEATGASRDQVLAELGLKQVEKAPAPAPKPAPAHAADTGTYDDLDPSSPNYRYRDTGYVAGSRKENAALMLRQAKRDGTQVRGTAIDWETLEQNPREAKEVITKSHLFGSVDWEALKAGGMEPGAGFLVDRIYAAVGTVPTDDTPQARQDYTLGLESLRDRLERCKTADEVTKVLTEIRDEWEGINLNEAEAAEYASLREQGKNLAAPYYTAREHLDALAKEASRFADAARHLEYKKRRTPDEEKDMAVLKTQASEAWDKAAKFRAANPYFFEGKRRELGGGWSANDSDAEWDMRQLRNQQDAVVAAAKIRNAIESPTHRAWAQMGERFVNLLNYRKFKGSDTFAKHVANAKGGRVKDWSWAEKEAKATPRGASDESTRFQLLVADTYERQGGREVNADSTDAIKRAFGLREVQSGNWVLRDVNSAKFHTEQTAGALADLADLIGVPDQQIAMNGRLAMAFGARGRGNVGFGGGARAHYEPVERVINLTKMGGGGTLAHEWFHAMDNLLSEAMGGKADTETFLTEDPLNLPAGELRDAFVDLRSTLLDGPHRVTLDMAYTGEDYRTAKHNIERTSDYGMPVPAKLIRAAGSVHAAVQAVETYFAKEKQTPKNTKLAKRWRTLAAAYYGGQANGGTIAVEAGPAMSSFRREAVILDKGQHGKYWSTPKELAARAFQAWAEDRLKGLGRRNDYLSAKAENWWYVSPFGSPKPFPEGVERERTNAAFDRLMGAIAKGDVLAKALGAVDGPRAFFFKARGWFGPEHGGTHRKQAAHGEGKDLGVGSSVPALPSSAGLSTLAEARAYWREHFGGKTMALTVHSGGKEYPIKVRFGAENDHAFTEGTTDDAGQKTGDRAFNKQRAQAMDRILGVIDRPKVRVRNYYADLLLEHRIGGEHYTVVLTWRDAAKVYEFHSAHFKPAAEVSRLLQHREARKNKGPLQKGGPLTVFAELEAAQQRDFSPRWLPPLRAGNGMPLGAGPSDFKVPYGSRVYPAGSQPRYPEAPARNCTDSIAPLALFFKAQRRDAMADLTKAMPMGAFLKALSGRKRKAKVCMTREEFDAEHARLLRVLRSPGHTDDLEEADEQEQEVAEMKKALPAILFFKAKRPRMNAVMGDLFGDGQTGDLFDKPILHQGHTTKTGAYVAPFIEHHKVKPEESKHERPHPGDEGRATEGSGTQVRGEGQAREPDHWDALAGSYSQGTVADLKERATRNEWPLEFVDHLSKALVSLPENVRRYFDFRSEIGHPVPIVYRATLDGIPAEFRAAYESAAAITVNGSRIEFMAGRMPTENTMRHEMVHLAWDSLYGSNQRPGMGRDAVTVILGRVADDGEKMLKWAFSKAKKDSMDEIEAKFTRKKFNGFKRQQKNGSDYEVAESLKFSAELEAMVGGGCVGAAKAVGIKAGYDDQYPSIALHVAMAKRLGVEMAGAFAKEEGVAYLAGESAEAADALFAGMAEGMERKRVERGFPDSIHRILPEFSERNYKAGKVEQERNKEVNQNIQKFMREGMDWREASDKARAMVDPEIDAQIAEHAEYHKRAMAEYNRVRREYASKHPEWFQFYDDGSVYMRDRKSNEVKKSMPRIMFFKAIANNPGLSLQDVTDKAGHQTKRWKRTTQNQPAPRRQAAPQQAGPGRERTNTDDRQARGRQGGQGDSWGRDVGKQSPRLQQDETQHQPPQGPKQASRTPPLFHADELAIPKDVRQPTADRDALFAHGAEALGQLSHWLNEGHGVADDLGYKTYRDYMEAMDVLKSGDPGGMLLMAPLKSAKRSEEKVKADYGGDWSKLTDVVRASLAVDTFDELQQVLGKLRKSGLHLAKAPKDRFAKPLPVGYRDVLLNVTLPNGHIGELQVHVKPMLATKELVAHHFYEEMRSIEARLAGSTPGGGEAIEKMGVEQKRALMTADERRVYNTAFAKSVKSYNQAWEKATHGHEGTMQKAMASTGGGAAWTPKGQRGVQYFDKDGALMRRQSDGHWPEVYRPKSGEWDVYHNMLSFDENADPITPEQAKEWMKGG